MQESLIPETSWLSSCPGNWCVILMATGETPCLAMPKTQPLYTSAKSNLGDGVLDEVEKNSSIAFPGKGGHSGLVPLKNVCPNPGGGGGI